MHPDFIDEILSYEQWRKRTETSQPSLSQCLRKKTQSVREPRYRHNPQEEKPPNHVFFTLNTKDMDSEMEHMAAKVITLLRGQAYEDIEEINILVKKILQLKSGPEKPDWPYALVGKHGEGKSTVTNCLLGRHKLAGVSKGTKSCTQFATEFRYKAGAPDDTDKSDVTIAFFDDVQLKENMEENIVHYGRVNHPTDEDEDSDDENLGPSLTKAVTKYEENLSKEAYGVFRLLVKGDKQAEEELEEHLQCPERFTDGSLLEFLLRKQRERLQALHVDSNNTVTYFNVLDKLSPQREQEQEDIATVRKIAEALAPLVKLVTVATGGMLLRYGLVLLDIPGYGDLNQARIASANAHRRRAHGEIIVGAAPRIEDSEDLDGQIQRSRRAHGDRNTILVMNQIDRAYDIPDLHDVFYEIKNDKESPFMELNNAFENDPDAEKAYVDYLGEGAQSAMVRQLAEPTEDALKQRHDGRISVFSVVASASHDWLDENRTKDPTWGPYMSGIPHLKRGLLSLTAEQKLQIYHKHYFQILPSVVDDVHRILTKTTGKREILSTARRSLKQCFDKALRDSRAAKKANSVSAVLPIFKGSEGDTVTKRIKALVKVWSESTVIYFPTFLHTLVCKGIPRSYASVAYKDRDINWNRDLLETMECPIGKSHAYVSKEAHLSDWNAAMKDKSAQISKSITDPMTSLWALVENVIATSSAPLVLKRRMRSAWENTKTSIRDMVNHFPRQISTAIDQAYIYVTTEEDIGCMIAGMNLQTYAHAEFQRRGNRAYTRQRRSLIKNLCEPDSDGRTFVDRYEASAKTEMNKRIARVSDDFIAAVDAKLKEFIRITEQFVETDIYSTAQHAAARKILQSWLPEFQDLLLECQRQFPGQELQPGVRLVGSIKRGPSCEREETPMKKIKVEDEDDDASELNMGVAGMSAVKGNRANKGTSDVSAIEKKSIKKETTDESTSYTSDIDESEDGESEDGESEDSESEDSASGDSETGHSESDDSDDASDLSDMDIKELEMLANSPSYSEPHSDYDSSDY